MWLGVVINICKHIQLQSSTETDQAPQAAPELPSCTACERAKGEQRGPLGSFPGKGMIRQVNLLILSELKSHELRCSDPVVSAGTRDSSMIQQWSYQMGSTSA